MSLNLKSVSKLLIPTILFSVVAYPNYAQEKAVQEGPSASVQQTNTIQVKGQIKDAFGDPISAANISIPGKAAAISDEQGNFQIQVPNLDYTLFISAPGYKAKDIALRGKSTVSIQLSDETLPTVYDKAVLPYGEEMKNRVPYSVVSINTGEFWSRANETPDSYLQGKVAGLDALRKSGTPEIGANLYLRGYNTLYAAQQPLIIIDGVLFDNNSYGTSLVSGHVNNPLSNVELKDIDNITIIKDASAMYGTKGANGAILITTSRTKDVATRLNFGAYGGYNIDNSNLPLLQAQDYRVLLTDLLQTQGYGNAEINDLPYMTNQMSDDYYNYHQQTDWQKQVKDDGNSQNYFLKVAGGDEIATYTLSLGYLSNKGTIRNTNLSRYQTRFNANLNLTKKLKGQVNLAFTRNEQNLNHQGLDSRISPLMSALTKSPFLSSHIMDQNNVSSPNFSDYDIFGMSNPSVLVSDATVNKTNGYRFIGGIGLNYEFNNKFSLQTIFGVTFNKVRENLFIPSIGVAPSQLANAIGNNQTLASIQRLFSVYNDTYLTYKTTFGNNNKLVTNLGFRYNNNDSEYDTGLSYNTASDDFITLNAGEATLRSVGGNIGKWNWFNTYVNVNYIAKDRYFLTLNAAADASSRFGQEIKNVLSINKVNYAFLPSLTAAWLVSSEHFMANQNFVENLKLRASYGLVGNDQIGNYTSKNYYITQSFLGRQGLLRGNIGNPEIQWETNKKFNIGFDASFLKERLSVSFDYFNHQIDDMIIYEPVKAQTGFDFVVTNSGAMSNTGVETMVSARLINKKNVKWDLGFSLSKYQNKIKQLPTDYLINYFGGAEIITRADGEANLFYGYKTKGVYASDAKASESGIRHVVNGALVNVRGGDMIFEDINKDKIIDEKDKQVIGNPNPDLVGSFFTNVAYKRFSLNALFTFSSGNDIYNAVRANLESLSNYNNQTTATLNKWRVDGHITDMPRADFGDPMGNARFSDRWIEDGSYLRLRSLSLNYSVPVKSTLIKDATIYALANNLFTFTNYLGYDPEFSANTSIFSRGVDIGLNPLYKSVALGVRIGL